MGRQMIDRTGDVYGKWTVLGFAGYSDKGDALWRCVCECGTEREVRGRALSGGQSQSCRQGGCHPSAQRKRSEKKEEAVDWSVLEIPGVDGVARKAASQVASEYASVILHEFDDLYQEALIHLATRPSMVRECVDDQDLGLGVLHHRTVQGLVDIVRPEAGRANRTHPFDILLQEEA